MSEKNVPVKASDDNALDTREKTQTIEPPVDIFEIAEGLVVVADLPGVDKENVDVRVHNGILAIEGKTAGSNHGEPLFSEYNRLNYSRQFRLNEEVDQDKIKADMKYGVLTIQLPKAERAKPRRIEVKVG